MRCGVGKILAYNSPNRPPTAHVATLPLHYRYRYAATLSCALSSWLLEWSAAILITLDIVNTKNTSHIERKTRLSSLNPKGYFILRNKQLDSSCLSSIGSLNLSSSFIFIFLYFFYPFFRLFCCCCCLPSILPSSSSSYPIHPCFLFFSFFS